MYNFELLNKNVILATLSVNDIRCYLTEIKSKLPYTILSSDIDSWIDARTSPIIRGNISYLLKCANLRKKHEFMRVTHCISLTDTLWVRELGSNKTWDEVSPYKNRFSRIVSEIALNCNYRGGNLRSPSPEYTLDGSADKCWKREDGIIYLYKTTGERWSGIVGNRPYCEYYACQVAKQLIGDKSDYVRYEIKVSKTSEGYNKAYVKCPIFTSEQYGYLPIDESKYNRTELIDLDKIMDTRSRIILREMLVLDSIILNHDRHGGNYGFLFDNDTYRIIGMAPIFDNDCSLGYKTSVKDISIQESLQLASMNQPKTDMGGYIKQARWAMTQKLASNMKNMYPFHFDRLPPDIDLEDKRIEFMEAIVNSQIKAILGR